MKTTFKLSQEELAQAVKDLVGKTHKGINLDITDVKFTDDGVAEVSATVLPREKQVRGPRKAKDVAAAPKLAKKA